MVSRALLTPRSSSSLKSQPRAPLQLLHLFGVFVQRGSGAQLCCFALCEGRLRAFVTVKIGALQAVTDLFKGRCGS